MSQEPTADEIARVQAWMLATARERAAEAQAEENRKRDARQKEAHAAIASQIVGHTIEYVSPPDGFGDWSELWLDLSNGVRLRVERAWEDGLDLEVVEAKGDKP